jgi:hypothetical protein
MATSHAHGGEFTPTGPTHNRGYEPDVFSVKPILAVPAAVFITGIVAFSVTWILFANIFDPKIQEPAENADAAQRNAAPLNERFARISSSDAKAEVQQPRLEGLQQTETYKSDGLEVTAQMVPTKPLKEGNSPHYHAEDLRPDRIPELNSNGTNPVTGVTRMPINDAISLLLGSLKTRDDADTHDLIPNWDRPKESNGGSGRRPEAAKPAENKEPEKKGADPKKE